MQTTKEQNSAIKVIAHCIENDEQGVRDLLRKNGVDPSQVNGKSRLTNIFVDALSKSKSFALDFIKYVKAKSEHLNASGRESLTAINFDRPIETPDMGLNGISNEVVPPNTTVDSQTNSENQDAGGFFSGIRLIDLINTGVGVLQTQRDIEVSKNNKDAVTQAVQVERDKINLQPDAPQKNNTGVYVTLGIVGFVAFGTLIYFVAKK